MPSRGGPERCASHISLGSLVEGRETARSDLDLGVLAEESNDTLRDITLAAEGLFDARSSLLPLRRRL